MKYLQCLLLAELGRLTQAAIARRNATHCEQAAAEERPVQRAYLCDALM
jgi:hypothetical protein